MQVDLGSGWSLAVPLGGDIADQALAFEAFNFSLYSSDFAGVKKIGHRGVAVVLKWVTWAWERDTGDSLFCTGWRGLGCALRYSRQLA